MSNKEVTVKVSFNYNTEETRKFKVKNKAELEKKLDKITAEIVEEVVEEIQNNDLDYLQIEHNFDD